MSLHSQTRASTMNGRAWPLRSGTNGGYLSVGLGRERTGAPK